MNLVHHAHVLGTLWQARTIHSTRAAVPPCRDRFARPILYTVLPIVHSGPSVITSVNGHAARGEAVRGGRGRNRVAGRVTCQNPAVLLFLKRT